jgi:serine/threonine protein kinase
VTSPLCPKPEQLADLLVGKLAPEAVEKVAEHLESCLQCLGVLHALKPDRQILSSALRRHGRSDASEGDADCKSAVARFRAVVATGAGDGPVGGCPGGQLTEAEQARARTPSRFDGNLRQLGRYQLLEELGRGGMGIVYRALHTRLGKIVALKVLPSGSAWNPIATSRFLREQEAVGKLDHPHLVRAFDADEVDGVRFLVMEFCDGCDLARIVKQHGPLPVCDACEVIRQAALGLQHAHEQGLVHRDIKPSNLMLTRTGQVKVLDLGLALLLSGPERDEPLTAPGGILGTLDYMAPEQATDTHGVDTRADVYSLGCTLYFFLTGRAPFKAARGSLEKIRAHAEGPVQPVDRRDVPAALTAVLTKMLAKSPTERWSTAAEAAIAIAPFAAGCDLKRHLETETLSPVPPTASASEELPKQGRTTSRPQRFRRTIFAVAGAATIVLVAAVLYRSLPGPHPPAVAVDQLRLTVRRGENNKASFYRDLVSHGVEEDPDPIDPPLHVPRDDFRLAGRLTRAAFWYLLWIDTSGKVSLPFQSDGKQDEIHVPAQADKMLSIDPADPAGIHLLVLVAGSVPPAAGGELLAERLRTVGRPPQNIPKHWSAQPRGPGAEREAPAASDPSDYLSSIQERMPPGLAPVHVLFLRTEK